MNISYSIGTVGVLVALVALQQVWGVDFETATVRGHDALTRFANRLQGAYTFEDAVALMRELAPRMGG